MSTNTTRRVVTNISLTLDGRYAGPGGATDMAWLMPYAISDVARDHLTELWKPASTALLGRVNAEGFLGFWPTVADDPNADERDRGYARWLVDADKVVLSHTLTEAPWQRTRILDRPAPEVVDELQAEDGGDIVVFASASVIKALLAADRVDRLAFMIFPETVGGGARLFEDGLPAGKWALVSNAAGEDGTISLVYDRIR
ncbi:dihydrofolate reductase family protein [Microlunatus soli]|uniref:Dihydrofolate reductase n=1 Tax=Microlunatus soli TaxID=630515 RepID=A0A1H1P8U2_9ACTN|nr:dihydrofolate reductase family protein [Microlunatus soli]SDS07671.1 Dihydrofolate reductase [Microlunatus soli]